MPPCYRCFHHYLSFLPFLNTASQFDVHKNRRQNAGLCPWMHICGFWSLDAGAKWTPCSAPHSVLPTHFLLPTNL